MKPEVTPDQPQLRDNIFANFAELAALCGVAIAMPVLDVFGRAPDVFIEAKANRIDIWWFAGLVSLGPPLLAAFLEFLVGALGGNKVRRALHHALLGALGVIIALRAIRLTTGIEADPLLALSIAVAVLLVVSRAKFPWVRQWLRFGGFAPILFGATFLFMSPSHSLAQAQDKDVSIPIKAGKPTTQRPPIVLLVLDELPTRTLLDSDGKVDAERFPGFASIAKESTWFRNTTSVGSLTVNAVPAILTGKYPAAEELAPVAQNHPDNVFRLLGNGYRLNVSEHSTHLCGVPRCDPDNPANAPGDAQEKGPTDVTPPPNKGSSNPAPLTTLLKRVGKEFGSMIALHDTEAMQDVVHEELTDSSITVAPTSTSAPQAVDLKSVAETTAERTSGAKQALQPSRFADWLGRMDADVADPSFSMLHVTLPHHPFRHDENGLAYAVPGNFRHILGVFEAEWATDPGAAISAKQRHLLQVRYVDTLVMALRDRLVELGTWDDTIVIVTADHGAAFDPGGTFREWTSAGSVDILGVPLLIHGPGFKHGAIDDRPVQSVDIAPTIAELSEITAPWTFDGVSVTKLGSLIRNSHIVETSHQPDYGLTTVDVSRHLEQLLARRPAAGTDGGNDIAILRAGPSGELIGDLVTSLRFTNDLSVGQVTVDFPDSGEFHTVDGQLPAFITGYLSHGGANQTVVVAVDGRVAATSLTFFWKGEGHPARFAALIPPSWMQGDGHVVSFYVMSEDGALTPFG